MKVAANDEKRDWHFTSQKQRFPNNWKRGEITRVWTSEPNQEILSETRFRCFRIPLLKEWQPHFILFFWAFLSDEGFPVIEWLSLLFFWFASDSIEQLDPCEGYAADAISSTYCSLASPLAPVQQSVQLSGSNGRVWELKNVSFSLLYQVKWELLLQYARLPAWNSLATCANSDIF